jgi:hypothetical protein
MVYALVRVPLQPLGGVIADLTTPLRAIVILGGIFLAGAIIIHLLEAPISENNK